MPAASVIGQMNNMIKDHLARRLAMQAAACAASMLRLASVAAFSMALTAQSALDFSDLAN